MDVEDVSVFAGSTSIRNKRKCELFVSDFSLLFEGLIVKAVTTFILWLYEILRRA